MLSDYFLLQSEYVLRIIIAGILGFLMNYIVYKKTDKTLMKYFSKEEVRSLLKECMERAMVLKVPLKVEVEEGKNWFQAK